MSSFNRFPHPKPAFISQPANNSQPTPFNNPMASPPYEISSSADAAPYTEIYIKVPGGHFHPIVESRFAHGTADLSGMMNAPATMPAHAPLSPLPDNRKRSPEEGAEAGREENQSKKQKSEPPIIDFAKYQDEGTAKLLALAVMEGVKGHHACDEIVDHLSEMVSDHNFSKRPVGQAVDQEADADEERCLVDVNDSRAATDDEGEASDTEEGDEGNAEEGYKDDAEGDAEEDDQSNSEDEEDGSNADESDDDDESNAEEDDDDDDESDDQPTAVKSEPVSDDEDIQLGAARLLEAIEAVSDDDLEEGEHVEKDTAASQASADAQSQALTGHSANDVEPAAPRTSGKNWTIEETDTKSVANLDRKPEHTTANILPEGSKRASISRSIYGAATRTPSSSAKAMGGSSRRQSSKAPSTSQEKDKEEQAAKSTKPAAGKMQQSRGDSAEVRAAGEDIDQDEAEV